MKKSIPTTAYLLVLLLALTPFSLAAQCDAGETSFSYCQGTGEVNVVGFQVCPTTMGMAVEAEITAGSFGFPLNNLTVYRGTEDSGITEGNVVFGPATGVLPLGVIPNTGALADQCLIFVFNSNIASVSCQNNFGTAVEVCGRDIPATTSTSLTIMDDLFCSDDAPMTIGGGMPEGGVYMGPGVMDNDNGMDFTFDPTGLAGTQMITYTQGGNSAMDNIEVVATGSVSINLPASISTNCIDDPSLVFPGGGMPSGGVYSGPGITDQGDGASFRLSPGRAGIGTFTVTYTGPAPCNDMATQQIEITAACGCMAPQTSFFYCPGNLESDVVAFEVCPSMGFAAQATINTGSYSGTGDVLNVYSGDSNSGTGGTLVAANLTGDLSGTVVMGSVADECLIFVSTTGPTGSCQDGLETSGLAVCGEDIAPSVSFMNPGDFCVTDGVIMGLGGGLPTGGVYDGPGVNNNGNGETFSFDPVAAGVGPKELTYTAGGSTATVTVEVFASGVVSFSALDDLCIDAGVQTNLSGGSPAGGTYSGPGVTDNGNGTYNFNPGLAGLGVHTITYMDATGCMETAMDDVEVLAACGCPTGEISFFSCFGNNLTDEVRFEMCPSIGMVAQVIINQGTLGTMDDGLTVYQGDSNSGTDGTIVLGPLTGDLSSTTITADAVDDCLIFVLNTGPAGSCQDGFQLPIVACGRSVPNVSFTALPDLSVNAGVQMNLGGGSPAGGVYGGPGVTNNVDGTYNFDPVAAGGVGVYVLNYTVGGASATDEVEVLDIPLPTFSKSFSPNPIGVGGVTTLTFTINNVESATLLEDLNFTDDLPAGMTVASIPNITSSCGDVTSVTASAGGNTITLTDGSVGAGEICTISVNVTSSTVGMSTNTTGDLTSFAGNSGPATADLDVRDDRPVFTKSFSPTTINVGERSTLSFTIDNPAEGIAGIFSFLNLTDNLPLGMVVASPANVSVDCNTLTVMADPGTDQITVGGSIAPSTFCNISVDVEATGSGDLDNVTEDITFSSPSSPSLSYGFVEATLEVNEPEGILLEKRFVTNPVLPGGTTVLEFTITNFDRDFAATSISFTDDLSTVLPGLVATGGPLNDICGGAQLSGTSLLTFTGGTLAPDGSCTFSIPVSIPAVAMPGSYPNTTSPIMADIDGATVVGNTATADLFVAFAPTITKTFLTNPVPAGGTTTLAFTITNTSPAFDLTDITFTDNIGEFLSGAMLSNLPAGGSCGPGSFFSQFEQSGQPTFQVTGANIPAGGSCTFSVDVTVPLGAPGGDYTNTTSALTGSLNGTTVQGLPATDDLSVLSVPRLAKSFTDDPVNAGEIVNLEFTITYDEFATGDATAISFTDDLNAVITGLTAVGLPLNDVCGTGSQIAGTTSLTFTGGTMSPGDVCTFSVPVEVPAADVAPGSYTNTTSNLSATVGGLPVTGSPATDDLNIGGLSFTKEFIPASALPGEEVILRFTLDNTSTFDATNITFTDNLDDVITGMTALAGPPVPLCGGTLIPSGNLLIFTGGGVPAGTSCTFDVVVQVPANAPNGSYLNRTSDLSTTIDGGNVTFPPATAPITVNNILLDITKTFTDDPVEPGGTVTVAYTITNLDADNPVTDIAFTDNFDAILTGLQATGLPQSTCGGTLTGTGLLSFSGGSLAAGGSCTFSVTLEVPNAANPGDVLTSTTSEVSGTIGGFPVIGAPASDDLQILALSFSKAFADPGTVAPGGTTTLSFTITNDDPNNAIMGISFTDPLDALITGMVAEGLPINNVCGEGSILSGTSVINFRDGTLPPNGSCTFNVTVKVPCGTLDDTYVNTTSSLTAFSGANALMVAPATANLVVTPATPVTFMALDDLCINVGEQLDLGGGLPQGGMYMGPGVTDDDNGETYRFDPAAAGVGVHFITYIFEDGNGCVGTASDEVAVFDAPTAGFTALADLCENAGMQVNLTGGTPIQATNTLGVYSGFGVTNNANGTYNFDPTVAGVGTQILTYTYTDENNCVDSADDEVEIFAPPVVTFTAPALDLCIEDPIVMNLGGGLPLGGRYSGTGVTDDDNGETFSFDPMAAAPNGGNVTVTYRFTDGNACTNSSSDDIFVDRVCCELIVTCPPPMLTSLTCNDMIPAAATDEASFEALGGSANVSDDPAPCGTLEITSVDVFNPMTDICEGRTLTRTYTLADENESTECVQTLSISAPADPMIMCPAPITITCSQEPLPALTGMATATADCGQDAPTITFVDVLLPAADGYIIERTWTATDACGRSSDCPQLITVVECDIEITDPCVCVDNASIIDLDTGTGGDDGQFAELVAITGPGGAPIANPNLVFEVTAVMGGVDAFAATPVAPAQTAGNPIPLNTRLVYNAITGHYELPFYHYDEEGYSITVQQVVAGAPGQTLGPIGNVCRYPNPVLDPALEDLYCPNAPAITLGGTDLNGEAAETVSFTIDGNVANEFDPTALGVGTYTVVMTWDGTAGTNDGTGTVGNPNEPGCVQQVQKVVEVNDTEPPMAFCQSITVEVDGMTGAVIIDPLQIDNGSRDNCGIATYELDRTDFTCEDEGDNPVILTVTDINGNATPCDATITIEDNNVGFNYSCITNLNVTLGEDCTATVTPSMVLSGALLECVDEFIIDINNTGTDQLTGCGDHTYSIRLIEDDELLYECWGNIFAEDKTPPSLECPENTGQVISELNRYVILGELENDDASFSMNDLSCYSDVFDPVPGEQFYDLITFTPEVTGVYTFITVGQGFQDPKAALYAGDFDPDHPCNNIIAQNDGVAFADNIFLYSFESFGRFTFPLQAGQTYTYLVSSFDPATVGDWGVIIYNDDNEVDPLNFTGGDYTVIEDVLAAPLDLLCTDVDRILFPNIQRWVANAAGMPQAGASIAAGFFRNLGEFNDFVEKMLLTGAPTVGDNCGDIVVTLSDMLMENGDCGDLFINRTFRVTDRYQNCEDSFGDAGVMSCTQRIDFRRPTVEDIILPPFAAPLDCTADFETDGQVGGPDDNPASSATGQPYIFTAFGFVSLDENVCNIGANYSDEPRLNVCDGTYKFRREWNIIDWCEQGASTTYDQFIKVGDFRGPRLVSIPGLEILPGGEGDNDRIVISTSPFDCVAYVRLPEPILEDNCSPDGAFATYKITAATGGVVATGTFGDGRTTQAPVTEPGTAHTLTICAVDGCGNRWCDDYDLIVRDLIEPFASCDDQLNISIGGGDIANGLSGIHRVFAAAAAEGSSDNCSEVTLEIRRQILNPQTYDCLDHFDYDGDGRIINDEVSRDPLNFSAPNGWFTPWLPFADFTCCDVGVFDATDDDILVEVRVTDEAGNSNVCWMYVEPEDKLRPFCYAPPARTLSCVDLPLNFPGDIRAAYNEDTAGTVGMLNALFGEPTGTDNCRVDTLVELSPLTDLNDCGWGTITRRFEVWQLRPEGDANGNGAIDRSEVLSSTNTCRQLITITETHNFVIDFPEDTDADCADACIPGIVIEMPGCDNILVNRSEPQIFAASGDECYKLAYTYDVINWCIWDGEYEGTVIERLTEGDGVNDFIDGPAVEHDERPVLRAFGPNAASLVTVLDRDHDLDPLRNDSCSVVNLPRSADRGNSTLLNNTGIRGALNRGRWQYTQFVKVYDRTAPEVIDVTYNRNEDITALCTQDQVLEDWQFVDPYGTCDAAVNITFAVTDLCDGLDGSIDNITLIGSSLDGFAVDENRDGFIKANEFAADPIPFSLITNDGVNYTFTGTFPIIEDALGDNVYHALRVVFEDGCGNRTSEYILFDVIDCKGPAPSCINGITLTLMPQPEGGCAMATWAVDFEASAIYDCTGQGPELNPSDPDQERVTKLAIYLQDEVEDDPDFVPSSDATGLVLTEEHLGQTFVYVYGFDQDGNYDYCTTYIEVEAHVDCGTGGGGNLAGVIMTEEGQAVEQVEVSLNGEMVRSMVTPVDGYFLFRDLPLGSDYTLTPYQNDDHGNGVTTFDIVKINQHILGVDLLDSPYQRIAADVNQTETITILDVIQMRKLILNIDQEFANSTSWRFIPADYVFPNGLNPWAEAFPEIYNMNNLSASSLDADFVGVKIGDVNGSARANSAQDDERTLNDSFELEMDEQELKAGNTYTVPVYASELAQMSGFQGTLQLNGVELVDLVYGLAEAQYFGLQFAEQGVVTMSYNNGTYPVADTPPIVSLVLRATADQLLSEAVVISSRYTAAEAYSLGGEHRNLDLKFNGKAVIAEQFELYQNTPNPVTHATLISFYLPQASAATLTISDISGRTILIRQAEFGAGYHTINLDRKELGAAGVLSYTLTTGKYTATKQMVVLE